MGEVLVLAGAGLANGAVQVDPKDIKMTIKRRNGEIVDCVDIYKQPSLGNPLLKDLKQQYAAATAANGPYVLLPAWKARRVRELEYTATYLLVAGTDNPDFDPTPGVLPPDVTNQIGVGLFGYPLTNGVNNNPVLNIFYTADGGKTLCYNLNCGGFVQTNRAVALGASVAKAASRSNDTAPSYLVSIYKCAEPRHVLVNDADLGYYPRTLFPWLFPEATANTVGGTVLNTWPGGKHTDTIMGNGRQPSGDNRAAVAKGYVAVNLAGNPFADTLDNTVHTVPNCYDLNVLGQSADTPGSSVAFGGSGGPDCASHPA
ncbi:hypothetical protein D1007_30384 [Hordeum vulgare]|nr:hypothetical protein D1007_30384 [Hordeum vulgare]